MLLLLCTAITTHSQPIPFIKNNGQIQTGDVAVKYYAMIGRTSVFVANDRICFVTTSTDSAERIDLIFENPSSQRMIVEQSATPVRNNYYTANGVYENVHTYSGVALHNIYNNIDADISISTKGVLLQFTAKSDAVLNDISMRWDSKSHTTTFNNVLQLTGSLGTLSFQQTTATNTPSYIYDNTNKSIQLQSKIPQQTRTTIESLITMSSYYGGSALDSVTAMVNNSGNGAFACGTTTSTNFPTTTGVHQQTNQGGRDAFVTKLDASGLKVWSTFVGGSGDDIALAVTKLESVVAIAGSTTSKQSFSTSGSVQSSFGGGTMDGFAATINESNGTRIALTYIGGADDDYMNCITGKGNEKITIAGTTLSTDITATAHQQSNNGLSDAFVITLNSSLSQKLWSSFYGGRGFETSAGTSYLSDGSLILAGNTDSPNSGSRIAFNIGEGTSHIGVSFSDGFLVRFDNSGNRIWGRYYGGDNTDSIKALTISNDIIYVAGYTNSNNSALSYIATANCAQNNTGGGLWDGFVAAFRTDGTRLWGTYHGGDGDDRCTGLSPATNGDVYVCGYTNSVTFPIVASEQKKVTGGYDAFIGYYVASGTKRLASALVGGSKDDFAAGIARMNDGTILFCGTTNSTDFPTLNAAQGSNAGSYDMFIVKFIDLTILDVHETDNTMSVGVAPNPTNGIITVSHSEITSPTTVTVSSVLGERIYTIESNLGSQQTTINTSELASGMYIIILTSATGVSTITFVKQ